MWSQSTQSNPFCASTAPDATHAMINIAHTMLRLSHVRTTSVPKRGICLINSSLIAYLEAMSAKVDVMTTSMITPLLSTVIRPPLQKCHPNPTNHFLTSCFATFLLADSSFRPLESRRLILYNSKLPRPISLCDTICCTSSIASWIYPSQLRESVHVPKDTSPLDINHFSIPLI